MKLKSIIVLAVLLLLAGCGKTPAPSASSKMPPNSSVITEAAAAPSQELVSRESVETVAVLESSSVFQTETEAISTTETEAPSSTEAEADSQAIQTEAAHAETKRPDAPDPSQHPAQSEPPKDTEPKATDPAPTPTQPTEPKPTNPPHTHSYKTKTVSPTCTEKGYTEHSCSCGDSYRDSYTDALGHSFTEQSIAATCTSGGYTLRTCSRCDATETTNNTPALGHDYRDTVVAPTTSAQGYTEHTCLRCGDSYRDNYKDKLKEVFDLQAVIDYGNAYAQSLGFTVDKSMTLANSSYYPGYYGSGYSLDFLKQEAAGNVRYTYDSLIALGDTIPGFRCNIHASYEPYTDKYYIVFLYG
ncbi:MAG: hypothetical protein IKQ04_07250 [Oscillospiraceae bacterium]|nr:hypothetical protein [Oscillospiraceae bacterium]